MEALSSFKQMMNIRTQIKFDGHSKGGKLATVSALSANGIVVRITIFCAKTIDLAKPLFVFQPEGSENYILCNSKLDASAGFSV